MRFEKLIDVLNLQFLALSGSPSEENVLDDLECVLVVLLFHQDLRPLSPHTEVILNQLVVNRCAFSHRLVAKQEILVVLMNFGNFDHNLRQLSFTGLFRLDRIDRLVQSV